ncbi:unnamed protein product [Arctia plantaginis]|uniref:Uncharacterized protein n=1 Tax=Arctia plantaginis TaxID=874455 RepID=A0A8S1B1E6_ARCPL|nr:unnamed protein product [Arctia plantaginis]
MRSRDVISYLPSSCYRLNNRNGSNNDDVNPIAATRNKHKNRNCESTRHSDLENKAIEDDEAIREEESFNATNGAPSDQNTFFIDYEKQYILSLDSLDLNFLSQYVQKPSDVERVLWSKSVEADQAFYQVEIVSEERQDDDPFIESYESFSCYICNIDVPKIYYKQHNKSARHQNYKKLVEKVLENVKKQINIDIDNIPNNQEYDMFYCETCCKVVARNNKQNHKKSNYHIQSIENEQLTSKFIEMYINNKKTEDDIQSVINYEHDLDSEFSSPSNSDWCDTNNFIKNCKNNNVLNKSNNCNGIDEVEKFQKYLKEMIAKYNLDVKLPSMEGNSVVIVTPKGYKEKITTDAFHSYKKMNGFAFCLSCQKWVSENISEHSASEEHVRNIFQPVNDNFAREVVNDKQYSHCLICNERVLTTSNHVNVRPKHQKYLEPSVPKSNECERGPESISDMKSSSISNEKPSESNLSRSVIDSFLPPNTDVGTVEEKLNEYRKQFSIKNATQLKCLVCPNSIVPYVNNNIITHVEGRPHRQISEIDHMFGERHRLAMSLASNTS